MLEEAAGILKFESAWEEKETDKERRNNEERVEVRKVAGWGTKAEAGSAARKGQSLKITLKCIRIRDAAPLVEGLRITPETLGWIPSISYTGCVTCVCNPSPGRQRQEDRRFKVILGYTELAASVGYMRPYHKHKHHSEDLV